MQTRPSWLVAGALALTLGAGSAVAQNAPTPPPPPPPGAAPGQPPQHRPFEDLNLSAQQKQQMQQIMDETRQQMQALRAQTEAKINAILTPEQRAKLAQDRAQHPGGPGERRMGPPPSGAPGPGG
jgi:Spy/CpxP family protein refolding chaperone